MRLPLGTRLGEAMGCGLKSVFVQGTQALDCSMIHLSTPSLTAWEPPDHSKLFDFYNKSSVRNPLQDSEISNYAQGTPFSAKHTA